MGIASRMQQWAGGATSGKLPNDTVGHPEEGDSVFSFMSDPSVTVNLR
jgi:hypothetical protein